MYLYEELKEDSNQAIKFGINFDDEDNESIYILKGLYILFKNKKYFQNSQKVLKK